MKKLALALASTLLASSVVRAESAIDVYGRFYSADSCGYYTTTLGDFQVNYSDFDQVPAGSKILMKFAFHDEYRNEYWVRQGAVQMAETEPGLWKAELNEMPVDGRGAFRFNFIEYVFEITLPDGTLVIDNGGEGPFGHFASSLKRNVSCAPGNFGRLTVTAYGALDESER